MNRREEGFLLLTGSLGNPQRRPLTLNQLRVVKECILKEKPDIPSKEMELQDLTKLGCPEPLAEKTLKLLEDQEKLHTYLEKGSACHCIPVTRISRGYPQRLISCLEDDAPGCLWLKGDWRLLDLPAVALVGSRDLEPKHAEFARQVGLLAARQGYVLVSGNARGADTVAQESCLKAGGRVICVVADALQDKKMRKNLLYISEGDYDLPFSAQRALSRNRLIHSLAKWTFVARCSQGYGGTWKGSIANLKAGWSPVCCYDDGSEGAKAMEYLGATLVSVDELANIFEG